MASIESLKERARRHEQREEWREALDLYRQAIAGHDEEDQPDIALYNRVGDLQTRLGHFDAAAEAYEQAVDLYVESELPNNAIAVCKKMVRHLPGRPSIFLRMGQIRANQGFLVDARQSFLTYAERMQNLGDIDEAFRALIEFADLAPNDTDIRLAIAAQMRQNDRTDEAMDQLITGYRTLLSRGREDQAAAFEEQIREIDPAADVQALLSETPVLPEGAGETHEVAGGWGDIELTPPSVDTDEPALPGGDEAETGDLAFSIDTTRGEGEDDVDAGEDRTVPGFEPTSMRGLPHLDEGSVELGPLPGLDEESDTGPEDEARLEPLPTLDAVEEEPTTDEELPPLPLLVDESGEETPALGEERGEVSDRLEVAVEEAAAEIRADEAPAVEGGIDEVERRLEAGDLDGAVEVVRERMAEEPDELAHRRRMVELAFRSGSDRALAEAYLELAGCLERNGQSVQAQAVYQQVLTVEPDNAAAREALSDVGGGEAPPREVASSEDYVDLGALILDDEEVEKTTRFVVAYEAPSGDEAADFAKMLTQFKRKVAENVSADDVKAHHDLGTAYKEMGLYDEAILEYQQALRASASHLPTYELLGQCFIEKGEHEAAVRTLARALDAPHAVEDELIGIYYHMGRAHEALGNTDSAVEFYDRVFALDINFADVTERLRALR